MTRSYNSIIDLIAAHNEGDLLEDINDEITQIIEKIENNPPNVKASAKIAITLTIATDGDGKLSLTPNITSKLPARLQQSASTYWLSDGKIVRENPRQRDMFINSNVTAMKAQ